MESTDEGSLDTNPFKSLPTEILQKILSYLPIHDRIRVERVCRRWKNVSRVWRDVQVLSIQPKLGETDFENWKYHESMNSLKQFEKSIELKDNTLYIAADQLEIIQNLLSRAGKYVRDVIFFVRAPPTSTEIVLSIITEHCHNIESIVLNSIEKSAVNVLARLFEVNEKLLTIACSSAENIIEILSMRDWKSLDIGFSKNEKKKDKELAAIIKNSPSLENFGTCCWTSDILAAMSKCQKLKNLWFPLWFAEPECFMMINTSLLNRLTCLKISQLGDDVDSLINLLRHCINLERLVLFRRLRNYGLYSSLIWKLPIQLQQAVLALPKLEVLELPARSLTDEILSRLLKLKHLRIDHHCKSISENGIYEMIMNSECLEKLEIPEMNFTMEIFERLAKNCGGFHKILKIKVSTGIYKEALGICKGSKIHIIEANVTCYEWLLRNR